MPVVDFAEVFTSSHRILIVDDETNVRFDAHIAAAKRCLNLRAFAMARIHPAIASELNPDSAEAVNLAGILADVDPL
jgi:hypothetical protein